MPAFDEPLTGDWSTSNSTVVKTADGVHFGTYANGGALGGSLLYKGANGLKLSDVNDYSFKFNYKQAGNLRVRLPTLASSSTPTRPLTPTATATPRTMWTPMSSSTRRLAGW